MLCMVCGGDGDGGYGVVMWYAMVSGGCVFGGGGTIIHGIL